MRKSLKKISYFSTYASADETKNTKHFCEVQMIDFVQKSKLKMHLYIQLCMRKILSKYNVIFKTDLMLQEKKTVCFLTI